MPPVTGKAGTGDTRALGRLVVTSQTFKGLEMKQNRKWMLIFLILTLASVCFSSEADTTVVVKVGDQVPDFKVQTVDGRSIQMSDLKGNVVLLNFFATWCGPCNIELEHVEKNFWPQVKERSDFVWLTIGREHSLNEVLDFQKKKGLTFTMGADPDRSIYKKFAKIYIPRNFLIDKTGRIIWFEKGFDESGFEEMKTQILKLLNDPVTG